MVHRDDSKSEDLDSMPEWKEDSATPFTLFKAELAKSDVKAAEGNHRQLGSAGAKELMEVSAFLEGCVRARIAFHLFLISKCTLKGDGNASAPLSNLIDCNSTRRLAFFDCLRNLNADCN